MATKINGVKGMNDVLPGDVGPLARDGGAPRARSSRSTGTARCARPSSSRRSSSRAASARRRTSSTRRCTSSRTRARTCSRLRPEGTAGTVRAFIEHGAFVEGPQKWFYVGPMFRRERPQKGRYRQFHQIGCEAFGIAEPFIDAEQIALLDDYFARLGVKAELKLNTVGDRDCRPAYLAGSPRVSHWPQGRALPRLQRADRAEPAARPRLQGGELPAGPRAGAAAPRAALPRVRGALRRGEGRARRARRRATPSTRGSCAASTTTCAPPTSSRPTRSARSRRSPAAGATTGSSRRSAARPRRASASRSARSGSR